MGQKWVDTNRHERTRTRHEKKGLKMGRHEIDTKHDKPEHENTNRPKLPPLDRTEDRNNDIYETEDRTD